jgi:hypothetical protein
MPARLEPALTSAFAAALGGAAGLAHLAFDGLATLAPGTAPPHLLLEYAPEIVREIVSPLSVSIASSAVHGAIAATALLAVEPAPGGRPARGALLLGLALWAFWLLSEGLLALVWLSAPVASVLGGLGFGLVRSLAIGWLLWRLRRRRTGLS